MDDLGQVRAEEGEVDDEERGRAGHHEPQRLVPERADDDEEQDRVDRERAGDGDAVGGGEAGRGLEAEDERDHGDEEHRVDGGHVDLALGVGGVADPQPGQEAQRHGLAGDRERAGDHGLRRDHGGDGREHDHGQQRPRRHQQEERVGDGLGVGEDQRALAEVVEGERGEDEEEPGAPDRGPAEVAHVRVERLRAGDREHHRAEGEERHETVLGEELDAVDGGQRPQDPGVAEHLEQARRRRGR